MEDPFFFSKEEMKKLRHLKLAKSEKVAYNDKLDGDQQISVEEKIASYLSANFTGVDEDYNKAGKDILYIVLREFRTDLFEEDKEKNE